jgi:hypothetical protein
LTAVVARLELDSLADLRSAAEHATTELVWILGPGAVPAGDALGALLDVHHHPAASLPVDAAGAPVEAALGRFAEHDVPALLDAAGKRLVPLRHTRVTSVLIDRRTVLDSPPPDPRRYGQYAGNEWTARVFAAHPAVLVPASRVRVEPPAGSTPLHALRAARAAGWGKGETLRELHRSLTS